MLVYAIPDTTHISVKASEPSYTYTLFDCSDYLVANGASLTQPGQFDNYTADDGFEFEGPVTVDGDLTVDGAVTADTFVGVQEVTLAAVGATPNANAATLSGSAVLNLEPASATFPGVVTTGAQTFAGTKSFGTLLPSTDLGRDLGSATFTWNNIYGKFFYDQNGANRFEFQPTDYLGILGASANGAGAFGVKVGNNSALLAGTDRDIAGFYNDNFVTLKSHITSNGSYVTATGAGTFGGIVTGDEIQTSNGLVGPIAATGSLGIYGRQANAAAAEPVKVFNTIELTAGVDRFLMSFYRGAGILNKVADIAANGSYITAGTGTFSGGLVINTSSRVTLDGATATKFLNWDGTNFNLTGGNLIITGNYYTATGVSKAGTADRILVRGADANDSSARGVTISNETVLNTAGGRICTFSPDNATTDKASVDINGFYLQPAQTVTTGGAYTLTPTSNLVLLNPASNATVTMRRNWCSRRYSNSHH